MVEGTAQRLDELQRIERAVPVNNAIISDEWPIFWHNADRHNAEVSRLRARIVEREAALQAATDEMDALRRRLTEVREQIEDALLVMRTRSEALSGGATVSDGDPTKQINDASVLGQSAGWYNAAKALERITTGERHQTWCDDPAPHRAHVITKELFGRTEVTACEGSAVLAAALGVGVPVKHKAAGDPMTFATFCVSCKAVWHDGMENEACPAGVGVPTEPGEGETDAVTNKAIAERRADTEFMERIKHRVAEDRTILDRLAATGTAPCPARTHAVLGVEKPTAIGCGLLAGHDGWHRFHVEWGPDAAASFDAEDERFRSGPVTSVDPPTTEQHK